MRLGGSELTNTSAINSTLLQGITPVHPSGLVDLEVLNPGTAPVTAPASFTFSAAAPEPVLTLSRTGPLNTDLLFQWTSTGRPYYTVFGGSAATPDSMIVIDATPTTELRFDGAATTAGPNLRFFKVN